ncbi:MAG: ABC transporter permease [Planctomycetota bacterium]|jgi:ABC-2 type transport system permease protein
MSAFTTEVSAQLSRDWHHLKRQPFNIVFTLVQPLIWLVLFGSLMRDASFGRPAMLEAMGSGAGDYLRTLAGGILAFTVYGNAMAGGIPMLFDKENGFLTRMLAAPIARSSIVTSRFLYVELMAGAQTLVILGVAWVMGVRVESGVLGVLGILAFGALVAFGVTCLSLSLALKLKGHASFFIIMGTFGLPLMLCSSALKPMELITQPWMRAVAWANPMSWCANAMRDCVLGTGTPERFLLNGGLLVGFNLLMFALSLRVFRRALS